MAWDQEGKGPVDGPIHGYTEEEIRTLVEGYAAANRAAYEAGERNGDLKDIIREALKVLHRTDVSKKAIADRMRAALGMYPGEPVKD